MTDEQALYLTLILLYVVECAAWVPRGSAALVTRAATAKDSAKLVFPRRGVSNNKGGVVLGRLLPGAVATFLVPQWPISMARQGVLGWVAESLEREERAYQTGIYKKFEDAGRVRVDGRDVLVGGEALVTAPSAALARRVAKEIERVRDLPKEKREAAIEDLLSGMFDVEGVRARVAALESETRALGAASTAVFGLSFVGAPAAVVTLGIDRVWPFVLGAVYVATWVVAALFFRVHKRLLPDSRLERIGQVVLLALLPLSAMRASDGIARTLLHGFHPLAAALALAPRASLEKFAAHLLRDARYPREPACLIDDPEAEEVEAWFRGALRRQIEGALVKHGFNVAAMSAAPAPEDAAIARYCPRCLAQYGADTEACEDCGGVPALAIGGAAAPASGRAPAPDAPAV